MPPRGKPFRPTLGKPERLFCPYYLLVYVEFRVLIIQHILEAAATPPAEGHDRIDGPHFRCSCPDKDCGYVELHRECPVSC